MAKADRKYVDLTLDGADKLPMSDEDRKVINQLQRRVQGIRQEHDSFVKMCDRFDRLYYPDQFTEGGADLWPTDPSATTKGRSHVSVNLGEVYVNIPAALQAQEPIENMLATDNTKEARDAASALERVFVAWKTDQSFELKFAKAAIIKGLYSRTAGKVYMDEDDAGKPKPELEVIQQPRNLWLGYQTDNYEKLEWAAYVLRYEPNALMEEFGVDVGERDMKEAGVVPVVYTGVGDHSDPLAQQPTADPGPRPWLNFGEARIEVWDYWYRKPSAPGSRKMVTCNAVIAGNAIIQGPTEYPEYKGKLPYVPLYNGFVPGLPSGRSDLHDAEPLLREKYEKITAGSQMIANAVAGDAWQLVGPDAPTRVPANLKPKRNQLIGPGPGNRVEVITPFIAQVQLDQFLARIDRDLAAITGMNDLIIGLAPLQSLNSSKAINALIGNFELRISLRRAMFYEWRKALWDLALSIWAEKNDTIREIVANGAGTLDIENPSLSPRDEMETATRAANLVAAKLWSQRRGMDAVGVDDPETEQDMIREESTDATLFPDRVQLMAQLLGALQSLGLQPDAATQGQAQGQFASGQNDLRNALGAATPQNSVGMQSPDTMGQTPPVEGAPPEAGGPPVPFQQGPPPGATTQLQSMVQGGKVKGRILTSQKLPPARK